MALQVLIAGEDVTQFVQAGSISIKRAANGQVGTAQFDLTEPVGLLDYPRVDLAEVDKAVLAESVLYGTVTAYAEAVILQDGATVFRGRVAQVSISIDSVYIRYQVSCQDVVARLQRVVIAQHSFTSTTAGAIVAWLVSQAPEVLAQDTSFVADPTAVASFEVRGQSVTQALTSLADIVGAAWYVDVAGRLHWRRKTDPEDSGLTYGLVAGERVRAGSLSVQHEAAALANSIRVLAQEGTTSSGAVQLAGANGDDDGHMVSGWAKWNNWTGQTVASADAENNLIVQVEKQDVPPVQQETDVNMYAGFQLHALYGPAWSSLQMLYPSQSSIVTRSYSTVYMVRNILVAFVLPPLENVTGLQLRVDMSSITNQSDSITEFYAERLPDQDQMPVRDPVFPYVTASNNLVMYFTLPLEWYDPGQVLWLRIGWAGGQPGAVNEAVFSNAKVTITQTVPQPPDYRVTRSWLRFSTQNQLPAGASLTGARLKLKVADKTGSPTFKVRKSTIAWPLEAADFQAEAGQQVALLGPDQIPAAGQWLEVPLPASAINQAGQTVLCLDPAVDPAPSAGHRARMKAWEAGAADRPQLILDWFQSTPAVEYTAEDAGSIAQFGRRAVLIYDQKLTQQQCEQTARKELAQRAWPGRSIRLSTFAGAGVQPGQVVTLEFEDIGVTGEFIVQDLGVKIDRAGNAVYDMTLEKFRPDLIRILLETKGN